MTSRLLLAERINNWQSELWAEDELDTQRVIATNGVFYPVRMLCSPEDVD